MPGDRGSRSPGLRDDLERGLAAPICLTWELTYACNLACRHCLSSSGRRDPDELTPAEARGVVDELAAMQVFYVNVGGGEPMLRPDFFELLAYSVDHGVGVKFSTNGTRLTRARAAQLGAMDYVDVQVSVDGATAEVSDSVRGTGSFAAATAAMGHLADAGFGRFKVSVVMTRHNVAQLDALAALADRYGAQLRLTRLRPSGRGADTWDELHPTAVQQRDLYRWLLDRPNVLTGDSFFHLSALGEPLEGLNLCGAGRVVCLIDPLGDVYACPFVIHPDFLAGNVRCGGTPRCLPSCASPRARGPARPVAPTTPVAAAAWRPSSSPGSRSPAPTPSVASGSARRRSPGRDRGRSPGRGRITRRPPAGAPRCGSRHRRGDRCMPEGHTWTDVAARQGAALLVVPVGSYEQHGPHLPLDTDTQIAVALAAGLVGRDDVVVAPPVDYGASGEHAGFPGTLSIGTDVLAAVLVEIVRSARRSFGGVVFVSGHGGNADALARASRLSRAEGDAVLGGAPRVVGGDAHAGRTETALMLAVNPAAVRANAIEPGRPEPLATLLAEFLESGQRRPHVAHGISRRRRQRLRIALVA